MVSSISTNTADAAQMISQMRNLFLKNFADSYSKTDSDKEKKINEEVKSLIEAADTDKSGTLSKDELSSLDTSGNSEQAKIVNDLINGFDVYDKNHDKQLSVKELKDALKVLRKEFSQQDVAKMAKENRDFANSESLPSSISKLSSSLSEKIINNYDSSLSMSASSWGLDC